MIPDGLEGEEIFNYVQETIVKDQMGLDPTRPVPEIRRDEFVRRVRAEGIKYKVVQGE